MRAAVQGMFSLLKCLLEVHSERSSSAKITRTSFSLLAEVASGCCREFDVSCHGLRYPSPMTSVSGIVNVY